MRVVVTGGSGKAGRWVVRDLRGDHDVLNVDLVHDGSAHGLCVRADLTDLGQAHDVIAGADVVVHLAAIPAPELRPEGDTFRINMLSTYNVFAASVAHRVLRVIWASSETVLGLPFDVEPPAYAPVDEAITPRPESSYALSKVLGEEMAVQFARRYGTTFVGLRISNIMDPEDYELFPSYWADPRLRAWNLWGYVDARDVAQAVRRAITAKVEGANVCIIAAADTVMPRPSTELMAEVFPTVPLARAIEGSESLLSIDLARALLGYEPAHRWRNHVPEP